MQRMESQRGPMTCRVWCLESSSTSRWPPLVPIQRAAALCTSRAFTRAQEGVASVGGAASQPRRPLRPEPCHAGGGRGGVNILTLRLTSGNHLKSSKMSDSRSRDCISRQTNCVGVTEASFTFHSLVPVFSVFFVRGASSLCCAVCAYLMIWAQSMQSTILSLLLSHTSTVGVPALLRYTCLSTTIWDTQVSPPNGRRCLDTHRFTKLYCYTKTAASLAFHHMTGTHWKTRFGLVSMVLQTS